jgi:hypothetical protein
MRLRSAAAALAFCLACAAQNTLTVEQLIAFVKSSVERKMTDAEIARYLHTVKLDHRLSDSQFEDLLTAGLGQRTLQALHAIHDQSQSLTPADPSPPKASALPPPPTPQEQAALIAELREYALNYSRNLPNFLCAQVVRRKSSPAEGPTVYRDLDTLLVRLSYFEQKEDYRLLTVSDQPATRTYAELGGSTSTGEFGTLMRQIFEPASRAHFDAFHWAILRNEVVMAFHYSVEQANSHWELDYLRREHLVPGYSGFVFVDKDKHVVLRVTLRADGIPATFPIRAAETIVDYGYEDIAGRQFLVPVKAQMDLNSDGTLTRNETEFRRYQKYSADTTITFK